mgnify:CR=1 FL=1
MNNTYVTKYFVNKNYNKNFFTIFPTFVGGCAWNKLFSLGISMFAILSVSSESRYKPSSILAFNVGKTNEVMEKNFEIIKNKRKKNGERGTKKLIYTHIPCQ